MALAACSADSTRFDAGFGLSSGDDMSTASLRPIPSEPVYMGAPPRSLASSNYQQQPTFQAPPPSATPPRVERVALRPVPQQPEPQATPAVYRPAPPPAPAPVSGREHTVKSGDTLSSIGRRYGVSVDDLMVANGLTSARLSIDQVLKVPAPGASSGTRTAARTHTVRDGESIYIIADRYNVGYQELAKYNGLSRPDLIRPGQELNIPASSGAQPAQIAASKSPTSSGVRVVRTRTIPASEAAPADKPVRVASVGPTVPVPQSSPTRSEMAADKEEPAAKPTRTASLTPPAPMSGTEFRWPVRGRVISKFGPKPNGKHNDGINVAVPLGTSVKAAENGVVAYAGNELEGYGNLVLIRHADGWVSAYAHNDELLVKRGDPVKRGQIIAKAGQTGSVSQPQVHFELRKGSKPVDPLAHMAEM